MVPNPRLQLLLHEPSILDQSKCLLPLPSVRVIYSSSGLYNPNSVRVPGYTPGLYIMLLCFPYGISCPIILYSLRFALARSGLL